MWTRTKTFLFNHFALIFFISALLFSWLFIGTAHGATLVEQLDKSTQQALCNSTCYETLNAQGEASTTPDFDLTGDISYMTAHAGTAGTADRLNISLWDQTAGSWATGCGTGRPNPGLVLGGEADYTCSLGTPYTPVAGHVYRISIFFYTAGGFASTGYVWGSANESAWPYGIGDAVNNYDRYFITDTYLDNGPPPQTISIDYPVNGSTVSTLGFWGISYTPATSTTYQAYVSPYYTIEVTAGNTPSSFESTLVGRQDLATSTSGVSASSSPPASQGFIPGYTYWAQVDLYYTDPWGANPVLQATSSVISFTVSTTTFPGTFPSSTNPFPTSTISTDNACDPNSFFLLYGLCRLFVPQASDFYVFQIMKSYVQYKPPFGYIGSIVNAFSSFNTASSSVSLPSLTDFSAIFNPLDTGLASVAWLVFIFWFFGKARHIEL